MSLLVNCLSVFFGFIGIAAIFGDKEPKIGGGFLIAVVAANLFAAGYGIGSHKP